MFRRGLKINVKEEFILKKKITTISTNSQLLLLKLMMIDMTSIYKGSLKNLNLKKLNFYEKNLSNIEKTNLSKDDFMTMKSCQ